MKAYQELALEVLIAKSDGLWGDLTDILDRPEREKLAELLEIERELTLREADNA